MIKKIPPLIVTLLLFSLSLPRCNPPLSEKHPLLFYANQCDEDIRNCFLKAISQAKTSIHLIIYSLNDPKIKEALQKKTIPVHIVVDKRNVPHGLDCSLKEKGSGLMHQKIMICDQEKIWLGSSNLTSSSLRVDDNFVAAFHSKKMAKSLLEDHGGSFLIGDQRIELFLLPQEKKMAYQRVVEELLQAKDSLQVAMFTWTHPELTQIILDAHKKGLALSLFCDRNSSLGVSKKTALKLAEEGIPLGLSPGHHLLHHKMVYIDNKTLIMGSANWTKAAFSKNEECIVIIHDLSKEQKKKLKKLWHALKATST